jgi:hypothetical protein
MQKALHTLFPSVLTALLVTLVLSGCAARHSSLARDDDHLSSRAASLHARLMMLDDDTDPDEARRVAETSVTYSLQLASDYRMVPPARWHNLLIQTGFRERGLCYHWTEDLMRRLQDLNLQTYRLHWAVAHKGSDLREHNSVVITGLNQPFEEGLVLDPWRYSGDLHWVKVGQDSYPWEPLPHDQW